jgi:Mce-associated membrane protein
VSKTPHVPDDRIEGVAETADSTTTDSGARTRRVSWVRFLVFGLLPSVALVLGLAAGYLKYRDASIRNADRAQIQSVQATSEGAAALLSYTSENVEATLTAARDRLTGTFRDSYTSLTNDVVIPGAKEQKIAAGATVPAAAAVSASANHAVVLLFVNQTIVVGDGAPTATASAVEVTLDRVGGRWLISGFEPK